MSEFPLNFFDTLLGSDNNKTLICMFLDRITENASIC